MSLPPRVWVAAIAAAASLGLSQPADAQSPRPCSIDPAKVPLRPTRVDGIVVGSISPERVKAATAWVEKTTGARISPDYADLPRVVIKIGVKSETIAAVVDGPVPGPGERVTLSSRYRDPRSRCNFIPWTVIAPAAVS